MSENIHQVYIANPITSNTSNDLMYFGQSPYGATNDAAMVYSNFAAQFTLNALAQNKIFIGNASNLPVASTASYLTSIVAQNILFGSATNVVGQISTANSAALITDSSGNPSFSETLPTAVQGNITQLGAQSQALNMNSNQINNISTPTSANDAVNKQYADNIAAGLNPIDGVYAASTANLASYTYNNGVSGVGATLTAPGNGVFTVDGVSPPVGSRFLYKNDTTYSGVANGIYTVTTSTAGSPAVLTRATDYNQPNQIQPGDLIAVQNGTANNGSSWLQTATIVSVGVTALSFSAFFLPSNFVSAILTNGTIYIGNVSNVATQSSSTWPATTTANQLLYSSATNTVGGLTSATNGLLVTSNSSVPSILAGPGTTGNILQSNAAAAPAFSTTTYPATNAINTLLYASAANAMSALATANSGVLITSAGGVPSISTTLPSGITLVAPALGTPASGTLTNCTGYTVANLADVAWTDISAGIGLTGFSGSPTVTYARQKVIGKTCFFTISVTGTANADTFTITGMSKTANSAAAGSIAVVNSNGANAVFQAWAIAASGTTLTLYNNGLTTGWNTSGTKAAQFTGFYETT